MQSYKTIGKCANYEFYEKKSRFIGSVFSCETEEEAISVINQVKKQYPDATHHCYAYVIGDQAGIMRYSDDGEPSGTAGLPILGAINKCDLKNVCCVVTRYFGGILLGTGGLARAYGKGCSESIRKAGIVKLEMSLSAEMTVPYSKWDMLAYQLGLMPVVIESVEYAEQVTINLIVREEHQADVLAQIRNVLNADLPLKAGAPFPYRWSIPNRQEDLP